MFGLSFTNDEQHLTVDLAGDFYLHLGGQTRRTRPGTAEAQASGRLEGRRLFEFVFPFLLSCNCTRTCTIILRILIRIAT